MREVEKALPRHVGVVRRIQERKDWHSAMQSLDSPPVVLDPRCNSGLYEALREAAHLIQQNRFDDARDKALSAFGIIPSLAGGD